MTSGTRCALLVMQFLNVNFFYEYFLLLLDWHNLDYWKAYCMLVGFNFLKGRDTYIHFYKNVFLKFSASVAYIRLFIVISSIEHIPDWFNNPYCNRILDYLTVIFSSCCIFIIYYTWCDSTTHLSLSSSPSLPPPIGCLAKSSWQNVAPIAIIASLACFNVLFFQ